MFIYTLSFFNTAHVVRKGKMQNGAHARSRHEGVKPNSNLRYGRFVKLVRVALTTRKGRRQLARGWKTNSLSNCLTAGCYYQDGVPHVCVCVCVQACVRISSRVMLIFSRRARCRGELDLSPRTISYVFLRFLFESSTASGLLTRAKKGIFPRRG